MILGASFSHTHLRELLLDPMEAMEAYASLSIPWIRLGCYWNEIEREPGVYSFGQLDLIVAACRRHHISIVMTVGMKAPRWPEYYLPSWVDSYKDYDAVSRFITACVNHYKDTDAVVVWQVENEPLDPSGPRGWAISNRFLANEVSLVRSLDPARKIAITVWGNELTKRKKYIPAIELADIVGLDLYPRVPQGTSLRGPRDSIAQIQVVCDEVKKYKKGLWISELQMEPWGPSESFLPEHFKQNIEYALNFKPDGLFLWGFEWWYQQKRAGNLGDWNDAVSYFK